MYTYPHIPPDTPQFQSMLGPYQDDGFGQLIYALAIPTYWEMLSSQRV